MAIVATGSTQCQVVPHRRWRPSAQPKLCSARCKQLSRCNRPTHRPKRSRNWRIQAEEASADSNSDAAAARESPAPRDDDVLPDSLADALQQASESTALALQKGAGRCIVEILLPEFWDPSSGPVFAEEGDQQRFWKMTRRFIESLAEKSNSKATKAVYPDTGVAAMLKHQWPDAAFKFGSLFDRNPISEDDDLIILAAPDPPSLEAVKRAASTAATIAPLVLFNPRLASGDAGVGLNIRRLNKQFMSTFTTSYSLRPVADVGSVFRRYPGQWQVFVEDSSLEPGRYLLAAERPERPAGDVLDAILEEAMGLQKDSNDGGKGLLASIGSTISSLQRFSRSLTK